LRLLHRRRQMLIGMRRSSAASLWTIGAATAQPNLIPEDCDRLRRDGSSSRVCGLRFSAQLKVRD
jgi:hypothetical protein